MTEKKKRKWKPPKRVQNAKGKWVKFKMPKSKKRLAAIRASKLGDVVPRLAETFRDFPEVANEFLALKELDFGTPHGVKVAGKTFRVACRISLAKLASLATSTRQNAFLLESFLKNGSEKGVARCVENIRKNAVELENERRRFFELVSNYAVFGIKRGSIFPAERGRQTGDTKAVYDAFVKDAKAFLDGEIASPPEWPFGKKS